MKVIARNSFAILVILGVSALVPIAAHAGIAAPAGDLTGDWTLPTTCTLPSEDECVYEGGGSLIQDGNQVSGQASLTLVNGPSPPCPAEMMATVMGTLQGTTFAGMLDGGQLGILNFEGFLSPDGDMIIDATSMVPDGQPFQGTTCIWTAQRQEAVFIPTLNGAALALLAILLLGGGMLMLRRRRAEA